MPCPLVSHMTGLGCCEYHGEKDKNGRQEDSWGKLDLGE